MVKNAVDVVCGGLTYWIFGYAFSFGEDPDMSNPIIGWGNFVVHASEEKSGWIFSKFFFQASFATTATTIVSGRLISGGGGGGGTLIFSHIRRLGPFFWGVKILNFNIFGVFRKMNIFWGY